MIKTVTWYIAWILLVIYFGLEFFGYYIGPFDPFLVGLVWLVALLLWRCGRCGFPIAMDYFGDKKRGAMGLFVPNLPFGICKRCGCIYSTPKCGHAPDERDRVA